MIEFNFNSSNFNFNFQNVQFQFSTITTITVPNCHRRVCSRTLARVHRANTSRDYVAFELVNFSRGFTTLRSAAKQRTCSHGRFPPRKLWLFRRNASSALCGELAPHKMHIKEWHAPSEFALPCLS